MFTGISCVQSFDAVTCKIGICDWCYSVKTSRLLPRKARTVLHCFFACFVLSVLSTCGAKPCIYNAVQSAQYSSVFVKVYILVHLSLPGALAVRGSAQTQP